MEVLAIAAFAAVAMGVMGRKSAGNGGGTGGGGQTSTPTTGVVDMRPPPKVDAGKVTTAVVSTTLAVVSTVATVATAAGVSAAGILAGLASFAAGAGPAGAIVLVAIAIKLLSMIGDAQAEEKNAKRDFAQWCMGTARAVNQFEESMADQWLQGVPSTLAKKVAASDPRGYSLNIATRHVSWAWSLRGWKWLRAGTDADGAGALGPWKMVYEQRKVLGSRLRAMAMFHFHWRNKYGVPVGKKWRGLRADAVIESWWTSQFVAGTMYNGSGSPIGNVYSAPRATGGPFQQLGGLSMLPSAFAYETKTERPESNYGVSCVPTVGEMPNAQHLLATASADGNSQLGWLMSDDGKSFRQLAQRAALYAAARWVGDVENRASQFVQVLTAAGVADGITYDAVKKVVQLSPAVFGVGPGTLAL